ncbi:MAG: DUF418 domain-containing protein [Bacteroidota bacterium]
MIWFWIIGLVSHFGYALIKATMGYPSAFSEIGLLMGIIYHLGATVFALAISMSFVHIWASGHAQSVFKNLAILGRMALTNYIFQNLIAIFCFLDMDWP